MNISLEKFSYNVIIAKTTMVIVSKKLLLISLLSCRMFDLRSVLTQPNTESDITVTPLTDTLGNTMSWTDGVLAT